MLGITLQFSLSALAIILAGTFLTSYAPKQSPKGIGWDAAWPSLDSFTTLQPKFESLSWMHEWQS